VKTSLPEPVGPDGSKDKGLGPMEQAPPTLIFAGFARLPANAGGPTGGGVVTLEVEVDPYDMRIVDAACDCLPALGRKFLVSLLVGRTLGDSLTGAITEIRSRYSGITQRAMIAAVEDMLRRYTEHGAKKETGGSRDRAGKG